MIPTLIGKFLGKKGPHCLLEKGKKQKDYGENKNVFSEKYKTKENTCCIFVTKNVHWKDIFLTLDYKM